MAKLPSLADHYETIDIASPNLPAAADGDETGDYASEQSAGAESEPTAGIATDESTLSSPQQPRPQLSKLAQSAMADQPVLTEFPVDPIDEAAAEEAAKTAATTAAAEEFTPEILKAAEAYGFNEESAKRFGTPENLHWAMAERDRIAAEWGQKQLAAQQVQQQPPIQQPQQQAAQEQQPGLFKKFNIDRAAMSQKGFDDDTIEFLNGMAEHFNTQMDTAGQYFGVIAQQQQAAQQQITSQPQADETARLAQGLDSFVANLGPDWEEEYGKGTGWDQPQNSPTLAARIKLFQTVQGLQAADAQSNQRTPMPELLQRAHNALHFTKSQEIARKALAGKAQQRRGQSLARAGAQRGVPMTGLEKAQRRSQAFDRKFALEGAIG